MGILLCGLNGSGKSTLGKELAKRLDYTFIDNEDLFFPKDNPFYEFDRPRSKEEAIKLLNNIISENDRFIFAAVRGDYGEKLIENIELAVIIDVPKKIRIKRVRDRSFAKFGRRILRGGDLHDSECAFFAAVESKPEDYVESWLKTSVTCPTVHIDGTLPVSENVEYIVSAINEKI